MEFVAVCAESGLNFFMPFGGPGTVIGLRLVSKGNSGSSTTSPMSVTRDFFFMRMICFVMRSPLYGILGSLYLGSKVVFFCCWIQPMLREMMNTLNCLHTHHKSLRVLEFLRHVFTQMSIVNTGGHRCNVKDRFVCKLRRASNHAVCMH